MSDDDQALNADAIYTAMVYQRAYAETSEGQAAFRGLLDEKAAELDDLRSFIGKATGAAVQAIPVIQLTDTLKEDIYPGEPASVEVGIEFARLAIFGSSTVLEIMTSRADPDDPISRAISRFVADRAN